MTGFLATYLTSPGLFEDGKTLAHVVWPEIPCEECDGNGGFLVDSWQLYGIPGGMDWGERCTECKGKGITPVPEYVASLAVQEGGWVRIGVDDWEYDALGDLVVHEWWRVVDAYEIHTIQNGVAYGTLDIGNKSRDDETFYRRDLSVETVPLSPVDAGSIVLKLEMIDAKAFGPLLMVNNFPAPGTTIGQVVATGWWQVGTP